MPVAVGDPSIGNFRVSISFAIGMSAQFKKGCPIFTRVLTESTAMASSVPLIVFILRDFLPTRFISYWATHLVAFPQVAIWEPLAL